MHTIKIYQLIEAYSIDQFIDDIATEYDCLIFSYAPIFGEVT